MALSRQRSVLPILDRRSIFVDTETELASYNAGQEGQGHAFEEQRNKMHVYRLLAANNSDKMTHPTANQNGLSDGDATRSLSVQVPLPSWL